MAPRVKIHDARDLKIAAREYRASHWGRGPDQVGRVQVPDPFSKPLFEVGILRKVVYETKKGAQLEVRHWHHDFADGPFDANARQSPPLLAANADGDGLFIVGGTYRVTWRGIIG